MVAKWAILRYVNLCSFMRAKVKPECTAVHAFYPMLLCVYARKVMQTYAFPINRYIRRPPLSASGSFFVHYFLPPSNISNSHCIDSQFLGIC